MDLASHLSLVVDLSPVQWARAADDTAAGGSPLPLRFFLSQLLAFVNCHLAGKDENTLAVFGAFPGKRCVKRVHRGTLAHPATASCSTRPRTLPRTARPHPTQTRTSRSRSSMPPSWPGSSTRSSRFRSSRTRVRASHPSSPSCTYPPRIEPVALVSALTKALCCQPALFMPRVVTQRDCSATPRHQPRRVSSARRPNAGS
jgi:hypothetical protein